MRPRLHREDVWKLKFGPPWTPSRVSLPLAGFRLYPLSVINRSREYNSFP